MTYHPKRMLKTEYDTNEDGKVDDADMVDGVDIPNTCATVLTDHDRATHDALGTGSIVFTDESQTLKNKTLSSGCSVLGADDLPNTCANLLTDHNKATHDALGIDAATVGGYTASELMASWSVVSKSSDYTASNNEFVLVDASGGAVTITLPSPSSGGKVGVKKTDSSTNTVTISPSGSETIDGASSLTIDTQYQSYTLISDGTNWYIM